MTETAPKLHVVDFSELVTANTDLRDDHVYDFMTCGMPTEFSYLTFLRLSFIRERIVSTS